MLKRIILNWFKSLSHYKSKRKAVINIPQSADKLDYFANNSTICAQLRLAPNEETVPIEWALYQPNAREDTLIKQFVEDESPNKVLMHLHDHYYIQYILISQSKALISSLNLVLISSTGVLRFESLLKKLFNNRCDCYCIRSRIADPDDFLKPDGHSVLRIELDEYTQLKHFTEKGLNQFLKELNLDSDYFLAPTAFNFEN